MNMAQVTPLELFSRPLFNFSDEAKKRSNTFALLRIQNLRNRTIIPVILKILLIIYFLH
jgi:hypothetical protein